MTKLTQRGRQALKEHADRIDTKVLAQFEDYRRFRGRHDEKRGEAPTTIEAGTPSEVIEEAYGQIRAALAEELRDKLFKGSPVFFEKAVVDVLLEMGYGGSRRDAGEHLGRIGDEGLDGVIREDVLGLDAIYVQAKKWDPNRSVGRPDIQAFVGALQGPRASKGVFPTTARFTNEAREFASNLAQRVVLIDGRQLAELMIDYNVGVSVIPDQVFELKRLDEDYFSEEGDSP